jgi:hypothetical protein
MLHKAVYGRHLLTIMGKHNGPLYQNFIDHHRGITGMDRF